MDDIKNVGNRLHMAALNALLVLEEQTKPDQHTKSVVASLRHAIDAWIVTSAKQSARVSPVDTRTDRC